MASVATEGGPNDSSVIDQSLDTLLSDQVSFEQKQGAWKQLKDTGELDLAIAELEQRMANDPQADAEDERG